MCILENNFCMVSMLLGRPGLVVPEVAPEAVPAYKILRLLSK